jgi:hypothetical protein
LGTLVLISKGIRSFSFPVDGVLELHVRAA